MVGGRLSSVANELESANHLTNGEESKALGENNTAGNELAGSQAAGLLEEVLRRLEDGAVLDGLPQVLVEGLEGCNRTTGRVSVTRCGMQKGESLTEGSSSGRGRQSCRSQGRPCRSKRPGGFALQSESSRVSNQCNRGLIGEEQQ